MFDTIRMQLVQRLGGPLLLALCLGLTGLAAPASAQSPTPASSPAPSPKWLSLPEKSVTFDGSTPPPEEDRYQVTTHIKPELILIPTRSQARSAETGHEYDLAVLWNISAKTSCETTCAPGSAADKAIKGWMKNPGSDLVYYQLNATDYGIVSSWCGMDRSLDYEEACRGKLATPVDVAGRRGLGTTIPVPQNAGTILHLSVDVKDENGAGPFDPSLLEWDLNLPVPVIEPWLVISPRSLDGALGTDQDWAALDFGNVARGSGAGSSPTATEYITMSNGGSGDLVLSSINPPQDFDATITDPPPAPAGKVACTSNRPIPPKQSCVIAVKFSPMQAASYSSELTIADNAPNTPHHVALIGSAYDPLVAGGYVPRLTETPVQTSLHQPRLSDALRYVCKWWPTSVSPTKLSGWDPISESPQTLRGQVVQAMMATSDFTENHRNTDYRTYVYPDVGSRGLLSDPGNFTEGDPVERGRIEVEWERGAVGDGPEQAGIPPWAWPTAGDRVLAVGTQVYDCGHGHAVDVRLTPPGLGLGEGFRSEIHPPQMVVAYRNAGLAAFDGYSGRLGSVFDFGSGLVHATRADVYISTYGGPSVSTQAAKVACELAPPPDSKGPPLTTKADGCGSDKDAWYQPLQPTYAFDVNAPPQPTKNAELVIKRVAHPIRGGGLLGTMDCQVKEAKNGYRCAVSMPHAVPGALLAFGETIFVGWKDSPNWYRPHVRQKSVTVQWVRFDRIPHYAAEIIHKMQRQGLVMMYGYVNEQSQALLFGDGVTPLHEGQKLVTDHGNVVLAGSNRFTVILVDGQPLHLQFRAVAVDTALSNHQVLGIVDVDGPSDFTGTRLFHSSDRHPGGTELLDPACATTSCFTIEVAVS